MNIRWLMIALAAIGIATGAILLKGKFFPDHRRAARDLERAHLSIAANFDETDEEIILLLQSNPKAFQEREDEALRLAETLLTKEKYQAYHHLRQEWGEAPQQPEVWLAFDADALLGQGKRKEAVELLRSHTFSGPADTARLLRLAILTAKGDLNQAWEYLALAKDKDPQNGHIYLFRAQLLEKLNQLSMARNEYLAALKTDPVNPQFIDQLAEFYRRHGQYSLALETWKLGLSLPHTDEIWLKAWFWSHVVYPIEFDWNSQTVPEGDLKPLLLYLQHIGPEQFWNPRTYSAVPNSEQYLTTRQETYWLRLLAALSKGDESLTLELIQTNPFKRTSWAPSLDEALEQMLTYRLNGSFNLKENTLQQIETAEKRSPYTLSSVRHHFFEQLNDSAQSQKFHPSVALEPLLQNPEAFSAAFLAQGWLEAALELHALPILSDNLPNWIAFGLAQAMGNNRDSQTALEFATKQKETPSLSLLIGELLIDTGNIDAGLQKLQLLAQENSGIGFRAAWLSTLIYMEKKQYGEAKQTIQSQPRLAQDLLGRETLAKIALLEGKVDLADEIYTKLQEESTDAKHYLAQKAMINSNWEKAQSLIEELLQEFPNDHLLNSDLDKVKHAQAKAH